MAALTTAERESATARFVGTVFRRLRQAAPYDVVDVFTLIGDTDDWIEAAPATGLASNALALKDALTTATLEKAPAGKRAMVIARLLEAVASERAEAT